jgi:membrane associated rhomboid family serine protease
MNFAPVGIKCPDHAGNKGTTVHPEHRPSRRLRVKAQRPLDIRGGVAPVTRALIALNVIIYLAELGGGAGVSANSGWIFEHAALVSRAQYSNGQLAGVAEGEWWRLITAAFLHLGPIHLGMNMLGLWWLGAPLETAIGSRRYLMLYLVSGLAGSAGALILSPNAVTVGASGAIFGIMGAMLVLQYQATGSFGGPVLTLIIVNVAFSFAVSGISIGGHIGGLVGGFLVALLFERTGIGRSAISPVQAAGAAALLLIAAGACFAAVG